MTPIVPGIVTEDDGTRPAVREAFAGTNQREPTEVRSPGEEAKASGARAMATENSASDVRSVVDRVGHVPSSWANRTSTILEKESYHRGTVIASKVLSTDTYHGRPAQAQARVAQTVRQAGLVDSRTAADFIAAPGANPYAADQMGIVLLKGFRKKSFALIVLQAVSSLIIGIIVSFALGDQLVSIRVKTANAGVVLLVVWVVLVVLILVALVFVRHRYPWNYILQILFTLLAGTMLGSMSAPLSYAQTTYGHYNAIDHGLVKSPQLFAVGFYVLGLCILAAGTTFSFREDTLLKCLPVSVFAAIISVVAFGVVWGQLRFCPGSWLAVFIIIVALCIVWTGLECDRLATKLNLDEYMAPCILVWAELLLVTFVIGVGTCLCCMAMASGDGAVSVPCSFCYCDCNFYVYEWGNTNQRPGQQQQEGQAQEAPHQVVPLEPP